MPKNLVREIRIKNFKSVRDVKLELGRVNVFIGENGAGKSNILEAIAFSAAASAEKLDNEFLTSRGVRVTDPSLMRSAFKESGISEPIEVSVSLQSENGESLDLNYSIQNDNTPYAKWRSESKTEGKVALSLDDLLSVLKESTKKIDYNNREDVDLLARLVSTISEKLRDELRPGSHTISFEAKEGRLAFVDNRIESLTSKFSDFIIYSPENSMMRTLEREGQILPLGINGEGLLRFLQFISTEPNSVAYKYIEDALSLFSWYSGLKIEKDDLENCIRAKDKHLSDSNSWIDQRSTNEGFLFAAFYFSLFSSSHTPSFFAVDNIDASLNPKLCVEMVQRISKISKETNKQCILTTHNPAILDGLDLNDPDQKLFIISRSREGRTTVRDFDKKPDLNRRKMSELFLAGALGGLPKGF